MKAIKTDGSTSVLIHDPKTDLKVWVDVSIWNGELTCDWNMYIFNLSNSNDLEIREFQNDADNFDLCTSLAVEYLENLGWIEKLENDTWVKHISNFVKFRRIYKTLKNMYQDFEFDRNKIMQLFLDENFMEKYVIY
jgi:hypothetical protein